MRRACLLIPLVALTFTSIVGCKISQPTMTFKHRPKVYRTVVSLSPSTTEILASTLIYPHLMGRTAADNYPKGMVDNIPIVATTKPDYEKLTSLKPDLILYDGSLYNAQDVEKLTALGAALYKFDPKTLEEYRHQVFEVAELVGGETHASENLDRVAIEEASASGKPPQPSPKVAIIMPSESGDDYIAGTNSFLADVVKTAGGTPVGPSGDIFVKLSPELLVSQNPDVIIANGTKTDFKGASALLKDPRFQSVNAIKNHRVKVIDSDVLLRRGSRVDTLIGGIYRAIAGESNQ